MPISYRLDYDENKYNSLIQGVRDIYKYHPNPAGFEASYSVANIISDSFPFINQRNAMQNSNKIIEAITGYDLDPQGAWKEFGQTFKAQSEDLKISMMFSNAMLHSGERRKELLEEANEYMGGNLLYRNDFKDMSVFTDLLVSSGKLLPSMLPSMAMYLGGAVLAPVTGGASMVASRVMGASYNAMMEAGSVLKELYNTTDENGNRLSDEELQTAWLATMGGMGVINLATSGFEVGTAKVIQKLFSKEAVKGMVKSGAISSWATNRIKNYAFNMGKEALEESMEEFVGMAVSNYVTTHANETRGTLFKEYSQDQIVSSMVQAFGETAKGMVLTGLPGELVTSIREYRASDNAIKREANKYSGFTDDSYAIETKDITPRIGSKPVPTFERFNAPLEVLRINNQYIPVNEEDSGRVKTLIQNGARALNVKVMNNRMQDIDTEVSRTKAMNIARYTENTKYADNKVIFPTEREAKKAAERFALRAEGVVDFSERDEGTFVGLRRNGVDSWIVFTSNQDGQTVFDPLANQIQDNDEFETTRPDKRLPATALIRRQFDKYTKELKTSGATESDIEYVNKNVLSRLHDVIKEQAPDISEEQAYSIAIPSAYFSFLASKVAGYSTEEFFEKHFSPEKFITVTKAQEQAYMESKEGKQAIALESQKDGMVPVLGGLYLKEGTKRTIGIARGFTPLTVVHEMGHVLVDVIQDTEQFAPFRELYKAELQQDNGKIGVHFQERFTHDLETYIKSGEVANESLRNVFKKITDAIKKFIDYVKGDLDPSVKTAFDNLFSIKKPITIEPTVAVAQETSLALDTMATPQDNGIVAQAKPVTQVPAGTQLDLFGEPDEAADALAQITDDEVRTPDDAEGDVLFELAPPTDSEAFKAWFGDSKVVDENGEPLVVYHSTDAEFNAFDTSDKSLDFTIPNNRGDNIGSFFTTSVRNSKYFGNNTMEVYLSIQNPRVFDTQDNFREFVRSNFKMEEETLTEHAKFSNDTRKILEEQGYDGVIIKKAQFGGRTSKESWYVTFSPTQIKSVNNQGTWDAGNPNILASIEYRVGLDQVKTMLRNGEYPSDSDLELHKGDSDVDWEIQFRRILNQDTTLVELFQDAYDKLLVELETKEIADENARLLELIEASSTSKIDLQEETGNTARFLERMKQQVSYMTSSEADSQFASRLNDNSYVLEVANKLTEDLDMTGESDISPYIVRLANHDNPVDYTYRMARQALRSEKTRYRQMFFEKEGLTAQLSYEDATAGQQTFSRYENNEVKALLSGSTGEDIKSIIRKGLATESVLDTLIEKMNEDIQTIADELGTTVEQVEILMRWIEEGDTEYKRRNSLYLKLQDINKNNRDKYNKLKRSVQRKTDALKAKNAMQKLLRQGQSIVMQTPNYDANVMHDLNGFWNIMRSTIGKDNDLTGLFSHEGVLFKNLPEPLKQFFRVDDGIFFVKKLNNMTIGELQYLKDTMRDVKAAAKELVHDRKTEQIRRVGPTVQKALAAAYGVNAGSFLEARSEFSDIKADSITKGKKTVKGMIETQFLTMSRLIDKIDPSGALKAWVFGKNGVDKIVADEQRKQGERYDAARKEMDRLHINMKDLDKDFIKFARSNGEEVLSLDHAVGVYIYSQQADGLEKLLSANGNKLKQEEIDMILDKLPDKYKAWGDYLIQDMTSRHDAIADVYYNVKNKKLGFIAKYFPLVRGADEAKFDDMLEEEHFSRPQNPADSFTYKRQGGDYALALDATNVWYRMVHKQEHYISAAQWVNDTQYMLRKGGGDLKSAIGISKGQEYAQAFEDFVNRFAHRHHVYDTADTFINNIRSNLIVARLGFNIITAFKQIPSLMYFTAKFGPIRLIESLGQVIFHYKETSQRIYELSPQLKNRRFSNEFDLITQMAGKSAYQKSVKTIGKVGMSPIQFMDRMVVNTLWLGAYNASIAKGMDSESAALDATRFIADTQPGGSVVDTAAIYSSDSTLAKFLLMFSSQLNKNFNMIWADIPMALKQHLYGKALSYMLGLGLSFAGILLASGSFADKDDDERDILRLFASQLANQLPVIGNRVAPIISGDYFASEDTLIIPEVNSLVSAFKSGDEKRILDRWVKLGLSVGEVSGLPSGMGTKLYNTAFKDDDINLGYILNSGWAEAFTE